MEKDDTKASFILITSWNNLRPLPEWLTECMKLQSKRCIYKVVFAIHLPFALGSRQTSARANVPFR